MGERFEELLGTFIAALLAIWLYQTKVKHWLGLNPGAGADSQPEKGGDMPSKVFQAMVGALPSRLAQLAVTQATTGIAFTANTANLMTDVYTYTVPRGTVVHFRPADFLAAYLASVTPVELATTSLWELVVRDPTARTSKVICGGTYGQIKSFTDTTLKKYLGLARSIGPEYVAALRVNAALVIATANSYFLLTAMQEYAEV